ncbi:MAG: tRNA (adenosine(37)-N6)-dimethylallyltransferase MiaA [Nitrospirae bacterium GWD2_57_9]|nr:MAG: tRNA (adenosine(37)-N6)-dimethylallyltransferase MiaA [Nitrospirae bacterium GWD2_57_9]OGW45571.1 MAG: tRNA (adenosine(37)-N6)-dimethylallyltransferase MiaA [Nitrospirae bacterium GWC2_57_9]
MPENKPILIIAGPTAVGKTDASLLLARELGAEIVSADSMQIYRGMDIGTAKPTPEQRKEVYHHLIDIVQPDQPYSVGDYLRDARSAISGILSSGGTPIVVGGTGLYIRALTRGLFHGPPADLALREQLLRRESDDPGSLYSDLAQADPEAAVKIHPNDLRRTVRALEVFHLRDRKLSDFHREHGFSDTPFEFNLLFLVRSRGELYPRIEKRVDQMIAQGLEAEVRSLADRGYSRDLSSMQALGYQHFMRFFLQEITREEAVALLKRDTKRFAKRQFTWFRREPQARWVDITGLDEPVEIVERIKKNIDISNKLV